MAPAASPDTPPEPPPPRRPTVPQPRREPRRESPPRRPRTPAARRRFIAAAAAVPLLAVLITASVIALGNSGPSHGTPRASGPVWLGVELRDSPLGGAEIVGEFSGGPAQAAGLSPGDVIVAVDHTAVNSSADVGSALKDVSPGQVVPVHALRGPSSFTAQVQVAARPSGHAGP